MKKKTYKFCTLDELERRSIVIRWVDCIRDEIAAISVDREIVVVSSICPHFGGPLRLVPGTTILRCSWHGLQFDAKTRECLTYNQKNRKALIHRILFGKADSPMCAWSHWRLNSYEFQKNNSSLEIIYDDT